MSDQDIEQKIQEKGLNAPRLTPDHIDSVIVKEDYHVFPGTTTTVCRLELRNGYSVIGYGAAVSPENFDEEIGRKIARDDARNKIWMLEGYLLKERLFVIKEYSAMDFGAAQQALRSGLKVARLGWNGKGLCIELQRPDADSKMTAPYCYLSYPDDAKVNAGSKIPWVPSQSDMWAEDWVLVE